MPIHDPFKRLTAIQASIASLRQEFTQIIDQLRNGGPPALGHALRTAGRRRTKSPSGPLGPAVLAVLRDSEKPLRVPHIVEALKGAGHVFTSPDPVRAIGTRIYAIKGVRRAARGLFTVDRRVKTS